MVDNRDLLIGFDNAVIELFKDSLVQDIMTKFLYEPITDALIFKIKIAAAAVFKQLTQENIIYFDWANKTWKRNNQMICDRPQVEQNKLKEIHDWHEKIDRELSG